VHEQLKKPHTAEPKQQVCILLIHDLLQLDRLASISDCACTAVSELGNSRIHHL
jgi:hypothetical protein